VRAPRFECLFCEHCCYFSSEVEYPTVYPWEKRRLEKLAEEHGVRLRFEPILVYRAPEGGGCVAAMYRWLVPGFCPFFDRSSRRCKIHDKKPLACRMYPLILEMPSGNLMVSGKCDWVRRQGPRLLKLLEARPQLIPSTFPAEFRAAREAYADFVALTRLAEELGLRPVKDRDKCSVLLDIDEYAARVEKEAGRRNG